MKCREKISISSNKVMFHLLLLMLVPSLLLAQYVITRSVFDVAGERRESSSFELVDVLGQTAAIVLESSSYTLSGGFLYGFTTVGIGDVLAGDRFIPRTFALGQNYPNPFNPSTTIEFDIPGSVGQDVHVRLDIYNIRGQLVYTLLDRDSEPGTYTVHWDGRNSRGERVGSGIYLYRVMAGEFTAVRKMVVVK
jgi:hypothetical protein